MTELKELFVSFVDAGNGLLWGSVLVYLLIGAGLYFTFRTGFLQFRSFGHMIQLIKGSREGADGGISSFQAFSTSLAARVGTGNMAGVAVAIYLGGPGAVFWMWVTALVGMSTSFAESTLAQAYKINHKDNTFRGGPAYYIEKGLGQRWLGIAFAICLIIAFGLAFNGVQSNSIAAAMNTAFGTDNTWVGIILALATAPIIFGGMRSVARAAELIVPFMAIGYLLVALYVIAINITLLPDVFATIIGSALGFEQAAGGALGAAMMQGIKRGLFSNEAGMGSAPNAAATATTSPNHPVAQGYVQMLGVFIDTIVICTATAAIILLSGMLDPSSELTGIALTQAALVQEVGPWGAGFIAIAILLFAFTSLIANYSYGESNIEYIFKSKVAINIYRAAVLAMVVIGAVVDLPTVWAFADLSMGMMAIINLIAILALSGIVIALLKDYESQVKAGKNPTFDRKKFPKLDRDIDKDVW
ncbi:alanine/glycine:cation symporter family protein [Enterovibrio nigricans]|uniref:Alanine or glycine:cation symporter, AGCS family n=1 Tax=Enterovibrio nigricans DSM 22720 TaxID=1121868 RepID=A0A1T4USA8_9GAMM|nr:alanine/glycine:cation symporter family protein [Enterovibrio nigricans]PKF51016.1 alanine:cation symporter family protein [Enterovibrio nigricans]SKA55528.1 alanine or glycine:cation symporter, AGCS family [Enterovibrio nigricans DSM 22720]